MLFYFQFGDFIRHKMVVAGDLEKNLGRIVCEFLTNPREKLRIVTKLVKISTTIDTLHGRWKESGGTDQCIDLLYEPWLIEHARLRAFVTEHRDKIVLNIPRLAESVDVYLAPNPYQKGDWDQAWRKFDYNQKSDFHKTLETELSLF